MNDHIQSVIRRVLPEVRADLDALVRIPSVSADPMATHHVRASADLVARLFRAAGAAEVDVIDDIPNGRPAVLAHFPGPPGAPTVLLYAHHDVQPPGDPADWSSPPFEPTERDGRLYGRGTADDKAGIAAHLAAVRAFDGRPPVTVVVFVEGEEEIGSPTLPALLDRHRDRLAADVIVLADSDNLTLGTPAVTTSLRGLTSCVVELRALRQAVHSGGFGGAAPDALTALCRLLASLHHDDGTVAVEGLHTAPAPAVDYPEEQFRQETGMLDGVELIGSGSLTRRLWASPAVTVLAIDATPVAEAANILSPVARARVSLRVAPGDDAVRAREMLARHLRRHAPWGTQVTVTPGDSANQPFSVDTSGPAFAAAGRAFSAAYGAEVVHIGSGGGIPFVATFAASFPGSQILVTSAGADPDTRAHGPDESLHLDEFERACLAEALLLAELARPAASTEPTRPAEPAGPAAITASAATGPA